VERSISCALAVATVKGVPVYGMAQPFAGLCRNVDLDRSVGFQWVPPLLAALPTTQDVPRVAEEGNAVRMRASKRMHRTRGASPHARAPADDTSFARSSDPCRSFATSESFGATRRRWRARVGIAVGKPGESQEKPAPGPSRVDLARLAAPHRSRKGACVRRQKRKDVTASVPARVVRARGSCPHVVCSCRNR